MRRPESRVPTWSWKYSSLLPILRECWERVPSQNLKYTGWGRFEKNILLKFSLYWDSWRSDLKYKEYKRLLKPQNLTNWNMVVKDNFILIHTCFYGLSSGCCPIMVVRWSNILYKKGTQRELSKLWVLVIFWKKYNCISFYGNKTNI